MLLHLFWRFIKAVFNPLVDDTEIAINKIRHQTQLQKCCLCSLHCGTKPSFLFRIAHRQSVRSCIMRAHMVFYISG